MENTLPKHIHFIGICGVAMSALALAFKREGWIVTGSDVGFFPPVSTRLKDAGVDFYPGWHPDLMIAKGAPDLVVVGNVASSHNPEWLYVQEHKILYKSYPEVVRDFFIKQNSIVCAGTYGKSTSTALLTWIFKAAGKNPAHMFGCIAINDMPAAALGDSPSTLPSRQDSRASLGTTPDGSWSIVEGDEYKTARWDIKPKFAYYQPTHLLLTSVVWDHADVYPTEASYIATFQTLLDSVPSVGVAVVSEKAVPILKINRPIITYGKTAGEDYVYGNVKQTTAGVTFDVWHKNETYHLSTPVLGEYMADNATGCFAIAREAGIAPEVIIGAVQTFKGVRRRLEKRYEGGVTVFDDIAHSPTKAQAVLASLRILYSKKLIAIFEPNAGNRERSAAPNYAHAFAPADEVIIPRLTKIKTAPELPAPMEGEEITKIISETHNNVKYVLDDKELLNYIQQKIQPGDAVVFLGSHGWRGMIEELLQRLQNK